MTSSSPAVRAGYSLKFSFLLLGVLLIGANLRAPITSLGPVLLQIQQYFALGPTALGLLNAMPLLIFAGASPLAPLMTRRFGLEPMLFGALCAIACGCLLRSCGLVSGLWSGTVLIGCGIAVANVLLVPLIKRDFPAHTALCVGMYAATMALVAALASGLSAPLSGLSKYGWKLSLGVWALLALLSVLCWWPQLKERHRHAGVKSVVATSSTSVWRSAIAWQVSMFMALHTLVFYTLIDWFPSIVSGVGFDATDAGACLFAYQAVAVAANLATSAFVKRMPDQRLLGFVCSVSITVGLLGLLCAPTCALLWLVIAGIGAGMSMVICLSLFGLRARDHNQAASLSGMAQCIGYGIGAIGPFLAGWLHDITSAWNTPLVVLCFASCLQIVFAVLAGRNRYVGQ